MTVLRNEQTGFAGFSLGHERWAVLFWPLHQLDTSELSYALDFEGSVTWQFMHDLADWIVVECDVEWEGHMIWLTARTSESLLKHFLREPSRFKDFSQSDLMLVAEALIIAPTFGNRALIGKMPVADLVLSLVQHAADGDENYVKDVEEKMRQGSSRPDSKSTVVSFDEIEFGGPLDELVFMELGGDERRDFKDVADAVYLKQKKQWNLSMMQVVEKKKGRRKLPASTGSKTKSRSSGKQKFIRAAGSFLKKNQGRKRKATEPCLQNRFLTLF